MRILIAEDETIIRLDLRALLEKAGFEVCAEAKDGEEAVTLARTVEPDLALLDVKMPKLDGIDAARRILEERPIPIVMVTAYGEQELVSRAVEAGVFGYLVKPFRETDLLPAIATARARHDELAAVREEADSLSEALAARKAIERAKGLLMEREGLTEQDAFARLRKASQISGRPLKVVAEALIATLDVKAAKRLRHAQGRASPLRRREELLLPAACAGRGGRARRAAPAARTGRRSRARRGRSSPRRRGSRPPGRARRPSATAPARRPTTASVCSVSWIVAYRASPLTWARVVRTRASSAAGGVAARLERRPGLGVEVGAGETGGEARDLPAQRRLALRQLVDLTLEVVDLHLLGDDLAEPRQAHERVLHVRGRHLQRQRRDAGVGGGVRDRDDVAAEVTRDLERLLRRSGETVDVLHREGQLGRVALGAARRRCRRGCVGGRGRRAGLELGCGRHPSARGGRRLRDALARRGALDLRARSPSRAGRRPRRCRAARRPSPARRRARSAGARCARGGRTARAVARARRRRSRGRGRAACRWRRAGWPAAR